VILSIGSEDGGHWGQTLNVASEDSGHILKNLQTWPIHEVLIQGLLFV